MRPLGRRDPAPSRLAYRLHRLWLTPLFWRTLRVGLPTAAATLAVAAVFADAGRRTAMVDTARTLWREMQERPEFMVQVLAVDGATDPVARAVREMAQLNLPVTSFDLDLPALQARIEALDPIRRARVFVRPGGVLQVSVEERVPALIHRTAGGLVLVDRTGHPVAPLGTRSDRADLPLIAGPGAARQAAEALELADTARPIADRVRGFVRMGERRWDVVLTRGQRVLLPEEAPGAALEQAIALHQAQDLLDRDVSVVDLRDPQRPTLRLTSHAQSELRRIGVIAAGGPTR